MNNLTSPGLQQFIVIASTLPSVCAILIGLALALRNMSRYERPATLTFVAMLLLLTATIGQPLTLSWILPMTRMDTSKFPLAFAAINFAYTLVRALSFIILVRAVFVDRAGTEQALAPGNALPPPQARIL